MKLLKYKTSTLDILLCLLVHLWIYGCTRIAINGPEESAKIRYAFGTIAIELSPTSDTLLSEINGFGLVSSPMGYSIGFTRQTILAIASSCKAIFWVTTLEQLYEFEKLLGNDRTICPVLMNDKEN